MDLFKPVYLLLDIRNPSNVSESLAIAISIEKFALIAYTLLSMPSVT